MNFGRREQKVVLGISFLVVVGLLHVLVFSPGAKAYKASVDELAAATLKMQGVSRVKDPRALKEIEADSARMELKVKDIVTSLRMSIDPCFVPGGTPEEVLAKHEKQFELIDGKLTTLLSFDKRRGGNAFGNTEMSFFAEGGWNFPVQVPPEARGGRLRDITRDIQETLSLMEGISRTTEEGQVALARQRAQYERQLLALGVNNEAYRDAKDFASGGSLAAWGEYVPLLHKMVHARLLQQQIKEAPGATETESSRDEIYKMLEIRMPYSPLPGIVASDTYFLDQQLDYLNRTLSLMVRLEVAQVVGVILEPPSYLVNTADRAQFASGKQGWDSFTPVPASFVLDPRNETADIEFPTPKIEANGASDVGYCIPIVFQFRANNRTLWTFLYEVLREFPMSEIDQTMTFTTREQAKSGDIFAQVRIIYVPYLFGLPTA